MDLRVPKVTVVIALYGRSCTGKSVVAEELVRQLDADLRQCGKIIGAELHTKGVAATGSDAVSIHQKLDNETRGVASVAKKLVVIDGRFLDVVLRGMSEVLFVELICEMKVRSQRLQNRKGGDDTIGDCDDCDEELLRLLFPGCVRGIAEGLRIDTTSMTVEGIASTIIKAYRERNGI